MLERRTKVEVLRNRILPLSLQTAVSALVREYSLQCLELSFQRRPANNVFTKNISNALGVRHCPYAVTHTSRFDNDR